MARDRGVHTIDTLYALALHGGAGAVAGRDYSQTEAHLAGLAEACTSRLAAGGTALDIVEYAVAEMESSGLYVAGRGSAPNTAGKVELDASIMDGSSRRAGAVAAVPDVENPVRVARGVMELTPHVLLVAGGARRFAEDRGFAVVSDPDSYYCLPVGVRRDEIAEQRHGTVGAVALDSAGKLAAATSTGGTFGKLEGRVGDTPLIGAGTWADAAIAVSCTGTGEYFIRSGAAISVACRVRAGMSLERALDDTLADVEQLGGDGGIIAIDRDGRIAMRYNSEGMKRAAAGSRQALHVATFSDPG